MGAGVGWVFGRDRWWVFGREVGWLMGWGRGGFLEGSLTGVLLGTSGWAIELGGLDVAYVCLISASGRY